MDARELVQIAIALIKNPEVSVRDITLTVETADGVKDITVHSNGDLLRPLHIGEVVRMHRRRRTTCLILQNNDLRRCTCNSA